MPEPMIRGHVIARTAEFLRSECDPALALRVNSSVSFDLTETLRELVPARWYPRDLQVELLSAIAHAHGDSAATERDLVRCGAQLALGNNDFMILLTKLLTPELFMRKAERLWTRDHQSCGRCELDALDVASRTARLCLRGVGGFAHEALVWQGFMKGILDAVIPSRFEITQRGWSWADPAPDEITYDVRWS